MSGLPARDTARGVTVLAASAGSGKTTVAMGLLRCLADRAVPVHPFKAVSVVAKGRDPAYEHEPPWRWGAFHNCAIAGLRVEPWNNPVTVVKPDVGHQSGELYLWGEPQGTVPVLGEDLVDPRVLPRSLRDRCREAVLEAVCHLRAGEGWIVVEGAGASGELPPDCDLANHLAPIAVGTPVVLVHNPNRSGSLAALVGLHRLLPPDLSALLLGYVNNQVRQGSQARAVRERLAEVLDVACLGDVPEAADLDDYDGSPAQLKWLYQRSARNIASSGLLDLFLR
jgi:cobyric acid synthase